MKLRLELEVEYENYDGSENVPEACLEDARERLLTIAGRAYGNGDITGDSDLCVFTWSARVVRLDLPGYP